MITHNAVLKCSQQKLNLVKQYTTHNYDAVLDLYYAKARFYDAYKRASCLRARSQPVYDQGEYIKESMDLEQYLHVRDKCYQFYLPGLNAVLKSHKNV